MERILMILMLLLCTQAKAQPIQWKEQYPGVWKGTFGQPEKYTLLGAADSKPRAATLEQLQSTDFPFPKMEVHAELIDGKTYVRMPLTKNEQIYGLGLNFQTVHQRGKILNLHVDHYGGKDNGRTHAPVPFYVSSKGYGVLVNSAQYLTYYVGTGVRKDAKEPAEAKDRNTDKSWNSRPYSDAVEIYIPAAGVEIYVFAGINALDAIKRYNLFCGGGTLPPRWGLGFTQRVQKLYTAEEVLNEAAQFEEHGFPLDFIGLEPGWQSRAYPCTFEWDKGRFPDPAALIKKLATKGIRLNLWTNPYISPEAGISKAIEPYTGSHTVWNGTVPDLNHPEAKKILAKQFMDAQLNIGVSGYKMDEVDGYDYYLWPDIAKFPSGVSGIQMRQTYGVLAQKLTDSLYRSQNKRTYGLVRASNAGANNLPYVIYNDYYSHQDFITALVNSGFCGVLWTPEVRGSKTGQEWLRRFQSVVFSPMAMINAWSSGTKPWSFPEVAEQVKYYAQLRMELMPYLYSEFAKYHFDGTPPFRAMVLEEGFQGQAKAVAGNQDLETNPYLEAVNREVKDQYMCGEYILVAPLFAGESSRKVLLPKGNWYDFYTGKYVGNGAEIVANPDMDRIPVYVKDGGIIPMMSSRLHTPLPNENVDVTIRHYGEKEGNYQLYDDDGVSFDYEKGNYVWRRVLIKKNAKGGLSGEISGPQAGKPNTFGKVQFEFMTK
jgi:Alpha-glucosidases, family 31 of glycosyl hydrolases